MQQFLLQLFSEEMFFLFIHSTTTTTSFHFYLSYSNKCILNIKIKYFLFWYNCVAFLNIFLISWNLMSTFFCCYCYCGCLLFEIIKHSKDVAQQQQQPSSHVLSIKIILCVWLFCNCILCRFQHNYLLFFFTASAAVVEK